jgi:hypothetical protein
MTRLTGRTSGFLASVVLCGGVACSSPNTTAVSNSDSGRTVALSAGDELDVTLGSIGNQGEPSVTSTALHYDTSSLVGPLNPGGPTIRYKFTAVAPGTATITIPFVNPSNPPPFTLDVNVQ